MSVLGKLTGADKAKKQAKDARKQAAQREAGALGQLDPKAMQALLSMFMQTYMSQLAPQMMGAQRGLAARAGRTGMRGSGLYSQLQAGIPGQFANMALGQAIQPTISTAHKRSDIVMGRPIITNPARTGLTDLVDLAMQYYSGGKMGTGSMQQGPRQF